MGKRRYFDYVLLKLLFSDTEAISDDLLVGFDTMNEGRLISFSLLQY